MLLLQAAVSTTPSRADPASVHKSAKICNAELADHAAEIEKAGESAAAFFHACWTHTKPGVPTPIEANAKIEKHPESETAERRPRIASVPRAEGRPVRRRYTPAYEARRPPLVLERNERLDAAAPPATPLPPVIANTADTLGRVLRAAGLPPVQVPVLVPGTLDVVPVTLAPR